MTRCHACGRVIGAHENPHWVGGDVHFHPACCPACPTGEMPPENLPEPPLVERMKRGHRRGTPRAWAMRGVGS